MPQITQQIEGLTLACLGETHLSPCYPHSLLFSHLLCSVLQEQKLAAGSGMTCSVSLSKSASAGSKEPRKGPPVCGSLPPSPITVATPSGPVLTPDKHTCGHWVEVTGHSPPGTGDERGGYPLQGSLSHLRDSLAALRRWHCPPLSGLLGTHRVQGTGRGGGGGPGEKLSSSIQMRIVPPTLPGRQGPPLELRRSQNPHLRKWAPLSQGPPAQTFPGLCGF